jgi:hypothetical protein
VDDDLDGFTDTLESRRSVRLRRPLAEGRLPGGFRSQVVPLLRFLDRERLPYDLTTDVARASGLSPAHLRPRRGAGGPSLSNAPGVAWADSARWVTPELSRQLRRYLEGGGSLASFGADAFRRTVRLGRDTLHDPDTRPASLFGERTSLLRTTSAPLVVEQDQLGLFEGLDRFVGDFTIFEVSKHPPAGDRLLAAAGRDPGEPAFLAYSVGRGMVVRVGTPQWSGELRESRLSIEVPRVTKRIWRLLSRRR